MHCIQPLELLPAHKGTSLLVPLYHRKEYSRKLTALENAVVPKCSVFSLPPLFRGFLTFFLYLLAENFPIPIDNPASLCGVTLSGDGTCVHTHTSPYGHKVCSCPDHGQARCNCPRHYSDPDAHWGWDSDLGTYYFGYTLYILAYHDSWLGIDLPLHIRFLDARRHASVSGIVALKEFRDRNPDLPIQNLCFDSANDNYPTYDLCKAWGIRPFIDLNASRGRPRSIPDEIIIDKDGTPICQAGYRMVYRGYCSGRSRCKWRCPLACRKVDDCPCRDKCSKSPYGRCVYTKPEWDARLYPPVARGTREYKKIYKDRTSCERVNNRILNDYHLHTMGIHRFGCLIA